MELIIYAIFSVFIIYKMYLSFGNSGHSFIPVDDFAINVNATEEYDDFIEGDTIKIKNNVETIKKYNSNFLVKNFIQGSEKAFSLVIEAFNDGNKSLLKDLLESGLYKKFESIIDDRNNEEYKKTTVISINGIKIQDISVIDNYIAIYMKIDSTQINEVDSSDKNIVDDYWTFGKKLKTYNNMWKLISIDKQ
ncbi:MAG: Tim44/TimA family putative adaptor protein [Anaplasmataceae bacterium]|nr:Tim44/TimA family putative adaptor protein [Anaplasmataceae bacterium]